METSISGDKSFRLSKAAVTRFHKQGGARLDVGLGSRINEAREAGGVSSAAGGLHGLSGLAQSAKPSREEGSFPAGGRSAAAKRPSLEQAATLARLRPNLEHKAFKWSQRAMAVKSDEKEEAALAGAPPSPTPPANVGGKPGGGMASGGGGGSGAKRVRGLGALLASMNQAMNEETAAESGQPVAASKLLQRWSKAATKAEDSTHTHQPPSSGPPSPTTATEADAAAAGSQQAPAEQLNAPAEPRAPTLQSLGMNVTMAAAVHAPAAAPAGTSGHAPASEPK